MRTVSAFRPQHPRTAWEYNVSACSQVARTEPWPIQAVPDPTEAARRRANVRQSVRQVPDSGLRLIGGYS